MKKIGRLKLNTKLLAMFFAALFLVSLVSSIVFFHLLDILEEEIRAVNTEQLNSTLGRLDAELNKIVSNGKTVMRLDEFESTTNLALTSHKLREMMLQAGTILTGQKYTAGWVVFLKHTDSVISAQRVVDLSEYTQRILVAKGYDEAFWREQMGTRFTMMFLPETVFCSNYGSALEMDIKAVPMVMKSYWDNDVMIVIYLDMEALTKDLGISWDSSYYVFSEEGRLLYHFGEEPLIQTIPEKGSLEREGEQQYVLRSSVSESGLRLVRLVPESDAAGLVKGSLAIFLGTMLLSLAAVSVIFVFSLRVSLHPVNDMLELLARHSGVQNSGNLREAQNVLHQVLQNLEDQGRSLAQKDAILSEYALRSQLKNVHVDVGTQDAENDGDTYILFLQIRYRENARDAFPIRRSELENLLQDMLSGILRRLFETTLIFQIEPGQFVAKVTVPTGDTRMEDRMSRLMARLEQEKEFAWFTVVQSELLTPDTELSGAYARILEGARQAKLRQESQLLVLPVAEPAQHIHYSRTDEQRLYASVLTRDAGAALACAGEILDRNLGLDICYSQLETLCVAMINTAVSAGAERTQSKDMLAAASSVLNALVTKCGTAQAYCRTVKDFIFEITAATEPEGSRDTLLERTRQYLTENYIRDFSIEEMAEALGVSRSYLSTYYKNKTGVNLSDSIQMYRVEKATELLKDPDIRTGDVGEMVGFTAKNTFLRQFKKYTGMTPKEYQTKSTT